MKKRILRRPLPDSQAAFTELPPLLQRIYAARHVASVDELDKRLDRLLPYDTMLGWQKAVDILEHAITTQQRILVVGDFDADGATSTAVAIRALRSFGALWVNYLVPNRFAFGYGLTPELVEVAVRDMAPQVIVTVDNGIANHAGVSAAKAHGMHVVITDHHLAAATLPEADAIVNPNQPGDPFPSKNLAGVGVIFYVMLALRKRLSQNGWFAKNQIAEPVMAKLLDIVALGTVADLVALDRNNRILVHQGLRRIQAGQCIPGIVALLELSGRDFTRVAASDLGFTVAARLNAAGRLDDMSLGIECLLSDDAAAAREMARRLDQLNDERRVIEQDMQTQALSILDSLGASLNGALPTGLVLFDASWHQGVIGILASRMKERFHRPVVVFAPGQDNELKGSARSIAGLHIRDTLALIDAQHPELIIKFGGHAMAAGLTITKQNLETFSRLFNDMVAAQTTAADLEHCLLTDGALAPEELSLEVASLLRDAGPWGQAFPEPIFDDTFQIVEQRIVGDKHLKLKLAKAGVVIDAIAFFIDTQRWPNHRCQEVHAAFRLDVNEYKGRRNPQLIVDYLEPVTVG